MSTAVTIIGTIGTIACFAMFYALGVHSERLRWNDLIHRGVLPKPSRR